MCPWGADSVIWDTQYTSSSAMMGEQVFRGVCLGPASYQNKCSPNMSTKTQQLHALVCGGSIGGLMTAHALLKAGCSVTVLERAASVSSAGAVRIALFRERSLGCFERLA